MQQPSEALQKIACTHAGSAGLVIVQHHRPHRIAGCPIYPHITLLPGLPAILPQHGQRGLIRVENLTLQQLLVQSMEKAGKIMLIRIDDPIGHSLPGNRQPPPLQLLFLPVKGKGQRILAVHNMGQQAW